MSEVLRISTAPDGGGGHFGEEHCWVWIPEIVRPTLDAESLTNGSRDNVYIISMRECVIVVQCISLSETHDLDGRFWISIVQIRPRVYYCSGQR